MNVLLEQLKVFLNEAEVTYDDRNTSVVVDMKANPDFLLTNTRVKRFLVERVADFIFDGSATPINSGNKLLLSIATK